MVVVQSDDIRVSQARKDFYILRPNQEAMQQEQYRPQEPAIQRQFGLEGELCRDDRAQAQVHADMIRHRC